MAASLTAAAFGALGGATVGFLAALAVLQMKVLRNALLTKKRCSPIRDCIRPPLAVPGAVLAALIAGGLAAFWSLAWAAVAAAAIVGVGFLAIFAALSTATVIFSKPGR